jgi:uncharacterized protein YukE
MGMNSDTRAWALSFAQQMQAHRNSLAGKAKDANEAHVALLDTAGAIGTHANEHADWAYTATERWTGRSADTFDRRAGRVDKHLEATAEAARKGATIVETAHARLVARHDAVARLIDEYVDRATRIAQVSGAVSPGVVNKVQGEVRAMSNRYTRESAKQLVAAQAELKEAARQLRELERPVRHDGVADPDREPKAGGPGSLTRPHRSGERGRRSEPAPRRNQPGTQPIQRDQPTQPDRPRSGEPHPDRSGSHGSDDRHRPPQRPVHVPPEEAYPGPERQPPRSDAQDGYEGLRGTPFDRGFPRTPRIDR